MLTEGNLLWPTILVIELLSGCVTSGLQRKDENHMMMSMQVIIIIIIFIMIILIIIIITGINLKIEKKMTV